MFVNAIQEVSKFTRPIYFISREYKSEVVYPGMSTIFFVNELGDAITCKHVAELILSADGINTKYENFKEEKDKIGKNQYNKRIRELETKYGYADNVTIQVAAIFGNCTAEPSIQFECIGHPKYDLAIIRIKDFRNPLYQSYARFLKDTSSLQPGHSLCRLGYPFPEFRCFEYNSAVDSIQWTDISQLNSPRFPLEGMMTRHLLDQGVVFGVELSSPGLKGQSGGPLFDANGIVCGMQNATGHLHLGFDFKNLEIDSLGRKIRVTNQPFLHVGYSIHVDIIRAFLKENNINFYEA
jgi:hypothetical protein